MDLYLFTGPQHDLILQDLTEFWEQGDARSYFRAVRGLLDFATHRALSGDILREYAVYTLLDTPGIGDAFACGTIADQYLDWDIAAFYNQFFEMDWDTRCREKNLLPFPKRKADPDCPAWLDRMISAASEEELAGAVCAFFSLYYDRNEACFGAFRWRDGRLQGIRRAERFSFAHLAGIEHQKESLIQNARAFLAGKPAHNVLLVGGSGTGKSSCVKATLTEFRDQGLRLVELPKQQIGQLPALMEALEHKRCHYIVYIDDLSFEDVDEGYKELKVALDGQVEARLPHVLIYATSNRRHLVRESWKDRNNDEEIHENDTLFEKLSLSERFGLHLYFSKYSQKEYFAVVELLLSEYGVSFTDEIGRQAAAWALTYNGRSGRTAKQFVADYVSRAHLEQV